MLDADHAKLTQTGRQIVDTGRAILSAHFLSQIRKPQPIASMQRSGIEGAPA